MTTIRSSSDILLTSWLFTAWWSTWPGNHLVPCVAELVGSCILIHARRCLPDPTCLFYPSGLSLCLSVDHFCLVPVDDMVLFHGMFCDGWHVSYTALPCPGGLGKGEPPDCNICRTGLHFEKVKVKVWTLVIAPLTRFRLVTSSALQSRKWQLIGISQWCHSPLCGHPLPVTIVTCPCPLSM